jgi:RNA polymerase-binding transcription factor DksA
MAYYKCNSAWVITTGTYTQNAIELAQKKMLTGSYGECVTCGYAIPFERLMAVLSAERCAPCQEKFERTHMDGMRGASM